MQKQLDVQQVIRKLQDKIGELTTTTVLLELQLEQANAELAELRPEMLPEEKTSSNGSETKAAATSA
jgi:hypothetical protein